MIVFLNKIFKDNNSRTVVYHKNAILSVLFRVTNVVFNLVLVSIFVNYLNPVKYGILLTIQSVARWMNLFDIGLSIGLRNKLSEFIAVKSNQRGKIYVSSTYISVLCIAIIIFIIFLLFFGQIEWKAFFNAPNIQNHEIDLLVLIVTVIFLINFVLQIINSIILANQEYALNHLLVFLGNAVSVTAIFIISRLTNSSLILAGLALLLPYMLVLFASNIILFNTKYRIFKPAFRFFDFSAIKDIFPQSLNFFIIQVVYIIIFTSDNLIILRVLGPEKVVPYNISFKYMNIIYIVYGTFLSPLWVAFSDAYHKNEISWIKKKIWFSVRSYSVIFLIIVAMLLISSKVYEIWIDNKVEIPKHLTFFMALYVAIICWNTIFTLFINGISKIKLQTILSICVGIVNIPLSIFFATYLNMGSSGVILGTIICLIPLAILIPIQYLKIIKDKATGIWNK